MVCVYVHFKYIKLSKNVLKKVLMKLLKMWRPWSYKGHEKPGLNCDPVLKGTDKHLMGRSSEAW